MLNKIVHLKCVISRICSRDVFKGQITSWLFTCFFQNQKHLDIDYCLGRLNHSEIPVDVENSLKNVIFNVSIWSAKWWRENN